MFLELAGQSARDGFHRTQTARLINCYREPLVGTGNSLIRPVLALDPFTQTPGILAQAAEVMDGRLFVASGGRLFEIAPDGGWTDRGAIAAGHASMAGNNGVLGIVAGGRYFTWDGATLAEPAAGAFADFGSVEFFGGYTILTELGGRRFQWSALADAGDLPGLNFSTADGRDDKLLRAVSVGGLLLLLKEQSHEWWYQTGGAGAEAFERLAGGVGGLGLRDYALVTRLPDAAFMVGDDGKAHVIAGQGLAQPVSTPPVETAIRTCTPKRVVYYEDEGHMFCAIVFRDCPAWVFDIATKEWHERAEGQFLQPWSIAGAVKWRGDWIAVQDDGSVRRFRRGDKDGAAPLVKQITSHTLRLEDGARPVLRELEIYAPVGFSGGHVGLSISRDGGATWGPEMTREAGPHYGRRMNWRNLGQARQITARLQWTADHGIEAQARVRL